MAGLKSTVPGAAFASSGSNGDGNEQGRAVSTVSKLHLTDPAIGRRTVQTVGADAGDRLEDAIEAAVAANG